MFFQILKVSTSQPQISGAISGTMTVRGRIDPSLYTKSYCEKYHISGSQSKVILPPERHRTMSGDICGCHKAGGGGENATGTERVEARDATKQLT